MHGSTMSPANQFQSSSSGFLYNSQTISMPGNCGSHPASSLSVNQYPNSPVHGYSKIPFQSISPHFNGLRRPEPIPATNSQSRINGWGPNASLYPDSQISSPASSNESTTDHSSPTSPESPHHRIPNPRFQSVGGGRIQQQDDTWRGSSFPSPPLYNHSGSVFPPPNTVAPSQTEYNSRSQLTELSPHHRGAATHVSHRPDAVFHGGNHRLPFHNPRGCPETVTNPENESTYSNRVYAGGENTIAPSANLQGFPDTYNSPGHNLGSFTHSGNSFNHGKSWPSTPENVDQDNIPIKYILDQLQLDQEYLITLDTRKLNKFLKGKGISRELIKRIKQERRTMKNRGYAASCRKKREETHDDYQGKCAEIDEEVKKLTEKIEEINKEIRTVRHNFDTINGHWGKYLDVKERKGPYR